MRVPAAPSVADCRDVGPGPVDHGISRRRKDDAINRLLSDPHGRRIAAVVNDFGEINIDAALLSSVSDGVISLKNGCICCSLLGDLVHSGDNASP